MRYTLLFFGIITQAVIAETYYIDIECDDARKERLIGYINQADNLSIDLNKYNKIKNKDIERKAVNLIRIKSKDKSALRKIYIKLNKQYRENLIQKLELSYI